MWGAEGWGAASSADWVTVSRFSPSAPAPAAVKCAFQHRLHWLLQGQCARCTSVVPDAKETLQQHARVFCLVKGALETWDGDTLFLPPHLRARSLPVSFLGGGTGMLRGQGCHAGWN